MLREHIHSHLAQLKLKGMLAAYDEIVPVALKPRATPEKILHELLLAETAHREARSIRYRMGQARFPVPKDLDSFQWQALPEQESRLQSLSEGAFLAQQTNVIFVGGTGTGKTHLAIALGRHAIRDGHRVRFYNLVDLVNRLEQEKLAGQGGRTADRLARVDLVILDELGYLPFSSNGGQLLFHLISKLRSSSPPTSPLESGLKFSEMPK